MRFLVVALIALALAGCGLWLDLDPPDETIGFDAGRRDGGMDAGHDADVTDPCVALPEGAECGVNPFRICTLDGCRRSRCGDGVVDARLDEECDDGNEVAGDGCEPFSCTFTCRVASDCGASDGCSTAACVDGPRCVRSVQPDGTPCALTETRDGTCSGGRCVPATCGDGSVDIGEECDDGNRIAGDGCEPDCTRTCHDDTHCDDGLRCNGLERCASSGPGSLPRCVRGEPPPPPTCYRCSLVTGEHELIDDDGDGFAPGECPLGGDCDDANPRRYPGAPDPAIPGNGVDDDCDGLIDEDAVVTCLRDADGDGFGDSRTRLDEPRNSCPIGYVPVPHDSTLIRSDCDDTDPDVFPGQTAWFSTSRCTAGEPVTGPCYDYDCNLLEERRWVTSCGGLLGTGCSGEGWLGSVPACGESGTWGSCSLVLRLCTGLAGSTRRQQCR